MKHLFVSLLVLVAAAPAAAQTRIASPEEARASRALAAMWRPLPTMTGEAVTTACRGAAAELDAIEAAMPAELTPESLARVHALRGILIVPTDDPNISYFFPDRSLTWFASGPGAIAMIDQTDGFIGVRDAAGTDIPIEYGQAGGHPVIRVQEPSGPIHTFVGCAPTSPAQN